MIERWICKHLCKNYYNQLYKLLCEQESQIKNLKEVNGYLRQKIQELNIFLKGYKNETLRN